MCLLSHFKIIHKPFYLIILLLSLNLTHHFTYQTDPAEYDSEDEKLSASPSFEVRAILLPCSMKYCPYSNLQQPTTTPKPPYFERESCGKCKLSNCSKKVIITIRITNTGITHCKSSYVVVDHVFDPASETRQRLLYPYVVKIKQKPIMQTYSLQKESSVNEKSTEYVVNKNNKNYRGCKTSGDDTTCKKIVYRNQPVPYSTGFCCSCEDSELQMELEKFDKEKMFLKGITQQKNNDKSKKSSRHSKRDVFSQFNENINKEILASDENYPSKTKITDEMNNQESDASYACVREIRDTENQNQEKITETTEISKSNENQIEKEWNIESSLEDPITNKEDIQEEGRKNGLDHAGNETSSNNDVDYQTEIESNDNSTNAKEIESNISNEINTMVQTEESDLIEQDEQENTAGIEKNADNQIHTNAQTEGIDLLQLVKQAYNIDKDTELEEKMNDKIQKDINTEQNFQSTQYSAENTEYSESNTEKPMTPYFNTEDKLEFRTEVTKYFNHENEKKNYDILKPVNEIAQNQNTKYTFHEPIQIESDTENYPELIRDMKEKYEEQLEKEWNSITDSEHERTTGANLDNMQINCAEEESKGTSKYVHPRGGQDCSDKSCPPGVDAHKYQQSTHCLKFSKLWYTVYKLKKPTIVHELEVEVFEKHQDQTGKTLWKDYTNKKPLVVGTFKTENKDQNENLWIGYANQQPEGEELALNSTHRLLVPEKVEECEGKKYPELKGGPSEWLVIPNNMITSDGIECDKVGVGYEAFVKQPDRCNKPRGTCLKNQPKDLWCHDHRLERIGKAGSYFLKYFGTLPDFPLKKHENGENLTIHYRNIHSSAITIELKTDYNLVVRPHAAAVITEVYVDSTNYIKSTVTIKITNSGLVYGVFFAALTDCPADMPASFNNIQTKSAVIPPQHQHTFVIEIMSPLLSKQFYCSVEAKNIKSELLAFRRIRFQRDDRCICIWHCVCTCLDTDGGLKCQPLPRDHYTAAGFHGGLPVVTDYVQFTLLEELMTLMYHLFLTMTSILVFMGLIKAVLGCFYQHIGEWGLCTILGLPKPMHNYYEGSLKGREVVYDMYGWPIHPDTKRRVRNAPLIVEFCLNIIFFLIYPLIMINIIVRRMCFVDATDESEGRPCCLCGQNHRTGECPSIGLFRSFSFFCPAENGYSKCACDETSINSLQRNSFN